MGTLRTKKTLGALTLVLATMSAPVLLGCDLTKLTANSTSKLFARASPAFEQHWDVDLAGDAVPANIMQMEGLLRIIPENSIIVMNAVRLYDAYAFGWIEDELEEAQGAGDYERAEVLGRRARYMYRRALDLCLHRIRYETEGYDAAYDGGLDAFTAWLESTFDEREHADLLLWTGYSWGSYINASKDDMVAVADLPFAEALVRRSVALDEAHQHGAGVTFLAVVATNALGADLDAAETAWARALEITERKNLLTLVNYARHYLTKRGDREAYIQTLREILEAGDVLPEARLTNMLAKRRARRYLRETDERFPG
ncbi:MAG: TRAP transporter TatT component family protein [Myxococcota bacterium]